MRYHAAVLIRSSSGMTRRLTLSPFLPDDKITLFFSASPEAQSIMVRAARELASKDDLIVISRKEYEALLGLKKFKEFKPTLAPKRALLKAEVNFKKGKTLSYHELVKKLGFTN